MGSLADFTSVRVPGDGTIIITPRRASEIAALVTVGEQMLRSSPSDVLANAIQAAITNVEYGTTSDGGTAVNQQTMDLMNWVGALTDVQLATYRARIFTSASGEQMLISAVPEPSASVLIALALACLVVFRAKVLSTGRAP